MAIRQAIITYDPDVTSQWGSAQESSVSHIFYQALRGQPYPRERGILAIRHIPDGNELIVAPANDKSDVLMSFRPCITLPLDRVEKLVDLAERNLGVGLAVDRDLIRSVREDIAGTRKQFDEVEIVAIPRVKTEDLFK